MVFINSHSKKTTKNKRGGKQVELETLGQQPFSRGKKKGEKNYLRCISLDALIQQGCLKGVIR